MADTEENKCLGNNIHLSLDSLLGVLVSFSNDIKTIKQNTIETAEAVKNIKTYLEHIHRSHLHQAFHAVDDIENSPEGAAILPTVITPIDHLLKEYHTNYDIDGNGLIYGVDFRLDPKTAPQAIFDINKLLDSKLKILTLEQYKATIPGNEKIWQR